MGRRSSARDKCCRLLSSVDGQQSSDNASEVHAWASALQEGGSATAHLHHGVGVVQVWLCTQVPGLVPVLGGVGAAVHLLLQRLRQGRGLQAVPPAEDVAHGQVHLHKGSG